jgi:hypothetical protein
VLQNQTIPVDKRSYSSWQVSKTSQYQKITLIKKLNIRVLTFTIKAESFTINAVVLLEKENNKSVDIWYQLRLPRSQIFHF